MTAWLHEVAVDVVHTRLDGMLPTVVTILAVVLVAGWMLVRRRRGIGIATVVVVVFAVAAQLNSQVAGYPTLAAALGHPPVGDVVEAVIPGPVSGFQARPASIYVPPAYLADPRPELPVLVLLTGQPGHVVDWIDGGHLARTMDEFASAHGGLAPVVIVADALGEADANPMCMDSNLGNVFTYLTVDLPAWASVHLQVSPDTTNWAIGGYSYGGTCALQTAVRAPATYPTFLDISGEDEPRRGTHDESVAAAFGDDGPESQTLFDSVSPLTVMASRDFPDTAGAFVVGAEDSEFRPQTRHAYDAAVEAGIDARYLELPGGHSMSVWAPALEDELDWLTARMGVID